MSHTSSVDFDSVLPFQLSEYIFTKKIGAGASSSAYLVQSTKYENQKFCAKVMELDECFLDEDGNLCECEIAVLTSLDHPNIIRMYDFFVAYSKLIIILELCEYGTLDHEIKNYGALSEQKFKIIAKELANAVNYCHIQRVAHRDIKPANVFIDKYDRAKLADFGLSALSVINPHVSVACGTYDYLAPEILESLQQNQNEEAMSFNVFKADIYALGITFYEMAVGKLPPSPPSSAEENKKNLFNDVHLNPKIIDLISKMIDVNPNERPAIAGVLTHVTFLDNLIKPLPLRKAGDQSPLKSSSMKSNSLKTAILTLSSRKNSQVVLSRKMSFSPPPNRTCSPTLALMCGHPRKPAFFSSVKTPMSIIPKRNLISEF